MSTKINFYIITCSAEAMDMDARSVYPWGESQFQGGLPGTAKEARRRIRECQRKNKCSQCDWEIHKCETERNRPISFPKQWNGNSDVEKK
jgi:hypothetical protein